MLCSLYTDAQHFIYTTQPTAGLMPLVGTRELMQDSEGYMWYATTEGGLCRDNGYQIDVFRNDRKNPRRIGQSNGLVSITEDYNGNIVFGTRKNVFVLQKEDYSIVPLDTAIADCRIFSVLSDRDGLLWVTTDRGVRCYNADYTLRIIYTKTTDNHSLNNCTYLYEDMDGRIWALSRDKFVARYDKSKNEFELQEWNEKQTPALMTEDKRSGRKWFGTEEEHVYGLLYDPTRDILWRTTESDLEAYSTADTVLRRIDLSATVPNGKKHIQGLALDRDGNVWVAGTSPETFILSTDGIGIRHKGYPTVGEWTHDFRQVLHAAGGKTESVADIPERISALYYDGKESLYIGYARGLYMYNVHSEDLTLVSDTLGNVRKIVADRKSGGIYFISAHIELGHCTAEGVVDVMVSGNGSNNIAQTGDGTIWTSDWLGNIYRYDAESGILIADSVCSMENGNPINGMCSDRLGNLWYATDRSLQMYNIACKTLYRLNNSARSIQMDCFRDVMADSMYVYAVGAESYLQIDPEEFLPASLIPQSPVLTCIDIDGVKYYGNRHTSDIVIPASAKTFTLYFSTFDFLNASDICYSYRMTESKDTTWLQNERGENKLVFINLSKGHYNLEVIATDRYGRWNSMPVKVHIYRKPAWWESWWAKVTYMLLLISGILLADRAWQKYRERGRRIAELQERLESFLRREDTTAGEVPEEMTTNEVDRDFIARAVSLVEQNIDNVEYNINQFSCDMCMSRSSLYMKFENITGHKPTEFIRSIRLKHAAHLIRYEGKSVTEAAEMTGFSSMSYFNRRFKEFYGVTPMQYR